MPRLLVPGPIAPASRQVLGPEQAHRLREVLRLKAGDEVTLFDGSGGEYPAIVRALSRQQVEVETSAWQAVARESRLEITLAQGISRGDRMDYTLQKAVELGVSRLIPIASARSQVKLAGERADRRLAHWRGVIAHACEQSGRDRVPELTEILTLAECVAHDSSSLRLTLAPGAPEPLASVVRDAQTITLVIGPEGGLAPEEIELLSARGYRPVRLGPRVLRTETAALVAITSLQMIAGDLGD